VEGPNSHQQEAASRPFLFTCLLHQIIRTSIAFELFVQAAAYLYR